MVITRPNLLEPKLGQQLKSQAQFSNSEGKVAKSPSVVTSKTHFDINLSDVNMWTAINNYRRVHGLTDFIKDANLCEYAYVRVKQLVDKGTLDNHEGFKDLQSVYFERDYVQLAENLAQGYKEADEIVAQWNDSIGHQALLQSSELNQACAAVSQNFVVLVAGKKIN